MPVTFFMSVCEFKPVFMSAYVGMQPHTCVYVCVCIYIYTRTCNMCVHTTHPYSYLCYYHGRAAVALTIFKVIYIHSTRSFRCIGCICLCGRLPCSRYLRALRSGRSTNCEPQRHPVRTVTLSQKDDARMPWGFWRRQRPRSFVEMSRLRHQVVA